jgi:hypothetical protein
MERKEIIHIASEVVVISGLAIYFKLKNNSLLSMIEKLKERLDSQDELVEQLESRLHSQEQLLNKHDQVISSLLLKSTEEYRPVISQVNRLEKIRQVIPRREKIEKNDPPIRERRVIPQTQSRKDTPLPPVKERRVIPPPPPVESEEESEEDLDEELTNELKELNNMSPVIQSRREEEEEEEIIEIDTSLKKKV